MRKIGGAGMDDETASAWQARRPKPYPRPTKMPINSHVDEEPSAPSISSLAVTLKL